MISLNFSNKSLLLTKLVLVFTFFRMLFWKIVLDCLKNVVLFKSIQKVFSVKKCLVHTWHKRKDRRKNIKSFWYLELNASTFYAFTLKTITHIFFLAFWRLSLRLCSRRSCEPAFWYFLLTVSSFSAFALKMFTNICSCVYVTDVTQPLD